MEIGFEVQEEFELQSIPCIYYFAQFDYNDIVTRPRHVLCSAFICLKLATMVRPASHLYLDLIPKLVYFGI